MENEFSYTIEVIEEFVYAAYIPFSWGIDRMLQPTWRRTPPLIPTGVIEFELVRGQLSKSRVVQV